MAGREVLAIGASVGGLEALQRILTGPNGRLDAAAFVVIHTSANSPGVLAAVLTQASRLRASYGEDGESIAERHVYVAQPDGQSSRHWT